MTRLISLFDLDPAAYVAHPIHGDERTYSETNCYVDCLVELRARRRPRGRTR